MNSLGPIVARQLRRGRTPLLAARRRLLDDRGSAVIELAFTLSIMGLPLMMGMTYFGTMLSKSIVVSNAAHAGAEYGMQSSTYASDTSFIIAAAQDDSGLGTNLTVTPTVYYACSTAMTGTQYATPVLAAAACTSGSSHPLEFLQVVASASVTPALTFPGQPATVTVSSTSTMEVEEVAPLPKASRHTNSHRACYQP